MHLLIVPALLPAIWLYTVLRQTKTNLKRRGPGSLMPRLIALQNSVIAKPFSPIHRYA